MRFLILVFFSCAVLAPRVADTHEFALESTMTAFVQIEAGQAHLVVQAPSHLLRSARFSLNARDIDLANAAPAVQRAVTGMGQAITIWEDGRALVPSMAGGRLSLPSDRSFDRYADAARHIALPVDLGAAI